MIEIEIKIGISQGDYVIVVVAAFTGLVARRPGQNFCHLGGGATTPLQPFMRAGMEAILAPPEMDCSKQRHSALRA